MYAVTAITGRVAVFREALSRGRPHKAVVLSTIGADAAKPNFLTSPCLLEEALADVDIPITFLRAAWFMENAQGDVASARDSGIVDSYLQPLDRKIAMIATDDVGRMAADLLLERWTGHRVVELEGKERVSPDGVAAAFSRALGRLVRAEAVPRGEWERLFAEQSMNNPQPRIPMIEGFNEGWIDFIGANPDHRKGMTGIETAIAALVERS